MARTTPTPSPSALTRRTWRAGSRPTRRVSPPSTPPTPQSWNRYAYVENQPLAQTDPLGLCNPNDPDAECSQGLENEKTAEGCLGAAPDTALFSACGGAWGQQLDDLFTMPVAIGGAVWVPGTSSAGPGGSPTENGQVVGSVTSSVQRLGHFEWTYAVGAGSGIFLPLWAPQFVGIDYRRLRHRRRNRRCVSPPLPAYSHSYAAQLACELGNLIPHSEQTKGAIFLAVAPALLASNGRLAAAYASLGIGALYDAAYFGSIRERCVAAVYGPGAW